MLHPSPQPGGRWLRPAALLVLASTSAACNGRTAETVGTDGSPDATALADDEGLVECIADGNACVPADLCCATIRGRRVDRARGCLERGETLLACVQAPRPGLRCVSGGEIGCYTRNVDGGIEVFYTTSTWTREQMSAFEVCSDGVQQEMLAAEQSGTCP
jgi:hypothetical protein